MNHSAWLRRFTGRALVRHSRRGTRPTALHVGIAPLLLLLSPLMASRASSQAASEQTVLFASAFLSFDVGDSPRSVAVGDLNLDGKPDLVTANWLTYHSGSISVLFGNGDGTFRPRNDYATGPGPTSVAIADLNGDGRPDIVTVNHEYYLNSPSTVSVLLGHGDGSFGTRTDYLMGYGPGALAIGDLNGDGKLDLAVANIGLWWTIGNTVSVLLGNGDGTFGTKTDYGTGPGPNSVAIADLNGDGRPDLATANFGACSSLGSTVSVLLGNGDGTFGVHTDYEVGVGPSSVAAADVSGDGKPDLVVANAGACYTTAGRTVSVLLGNGDGTFGIKTDYGTGDGPRSVAIGDVNGDGKPDLTVAGSVLSILLGQGGGAFAAKTDFGIGSGASCVAMGDLNGDSRPDVVVSDPANWWSGAVSVLLGNGDGTFGSKTDLGARNVRAVEDLNGDRRLDLVSIGLNTVSVQLGKRDGSFEAKTDYPSLPATSVAVADLNRDGVPDLATTSPGEVSTISVRLGHGDGTFGASTDYAAGYAATYIAIGELNGDGNADLVTANTGNDCVSKAYTVSVLLGNGDGTFRAKTDYATGTNPMHVAIDDLNGDGHNDLVIANLNNFCGGGGSAPSGMSGPLGASPSSMPSGDYYCYSTLLGNGDGSFGAFRSSGTSSAMSQAVAIGDLNGDGRPDLAVANSFTTSLRVLFGNGDGSFTGGALYNMLTSLSSVAIGDLNGDGKPDLAAADVGARVISVLLGNGDGTFGAKTDYGTTDDPMFLAIRDLNRDGRPDLVTSGDVLWNRGLGFTLSATVDLDPDVLIIGNSAPWLTAYIEPSGFGPASIDLSTVRLASSVPAAPNFATVGDHDGNGEPDLMVKFSRAALDPLLVAGLNELTVTGFLVTGEHFEARGEVRVNGRGSALSARAEQGERPRFALHGVSPNPVVEALNVTFSLSDAGRAVLRLFDVAGREVATREVGGLGPGRHTVTFARAGLAPGIYVVRLSREGTDLGARAVLVR